MRNTYIFDTSVLISDPYFYKSFTHSDIIIPIAVLNELDDLKKHFNNAGRHARICIRVIDEISGKGDISTGILLDDDILVKVDAQYYDLNNDIFAGFGNPHYGDTQILACLFANYQAAREASQDVTFVSNDINLRIKAKSRGIESIVHEKDNVTLSELYSGLQIIKNEQAALDLQSKSIIDPNEYNINLLPHECVVFEGDDGSPLALARKISSDKVKIIKKYHPWGISARNKEQAFAADLIADPKIDLVTLIGRAGTGKSMLVLASALDLVINKKEYERFVIYRPIQAVGNDIGFIPGTIEEKLAPWFQAIMDNFEFLLGSKPGVDWMKELEMFKKKGRIDMEAITYVRGRSIPNAIILVDEAQNLSKEDIKTILTRAGENTKIVLTGDLEQIDNLELNAMDNGLAHVIEKFKDSEIAGHMTLTQGERSRLATKAAEIL